MRAAGVRYEAGTASWRSDVGPRGDSGRRTPVRWLGPNTPAGRKAAEANLAEYLAERDRREAVAAGDAGRLAVVEVVARFLEHAATHRKRRTFATHAERLLTWMRLSPGDAVDSDGRRIDDRPAWDLKPGDLAGVLRALTGAGRSGHYVAGIGASVKACWAWAAAYDDLRVPPQLVPADVFAGVILPDRPQAPERYVPPEVARGFLAWIDARAARINGTTGELERLTALLFRAIYETGCRPDELIGAEWTHLDERNGVIVRREHKTEAKTRKARRVPINADLLAAILRARDRPGRHPVCIFTHKRGKGAGGRFERGTAESLAGHPWHIKTLGSKFRKLRMAAEAEGLDVSVVDGSGHRVEASPGCTLYDFRRTFATDADAADFSDERTAAAMGNSPEVVARVYKTRHARAAVEVAEGVAARRKS